MTTMLLVHGGLWENGMNAERFWHVPGVAAGLSERGFEVLAPDRLARAASWLHEAEHIAEQLPPQGVTVLAGSNGCSVAVRLALMHPERIERMILAWPATSGDPAVDERTRTSLAAQGALPEVIDALISGETLRGIADAELADLTRPVALMPAEPEDPFHQHRTVDALYEALPNAIRLRGTTESPRPDFAQDLERFLHAVATFAQP